MNLARQRPGCDARTAAQLTIETANVELDAAYAAAALVGLEAGALTCMLDRQRHRHRHGPRRRRRAHLRAVLHDERAGQGHRPRAGDGLRHREAERRVHLGLQRAGTWHDVQDLSAPNARRGREAGTVPVQRRAATRRRRPSCWSRTRRQGPRKLARTCSRAQGTTVLEAATPPRRVLSATRTRTHRSAADRRRDAADERRRRWPRQLRAARPGTKVLLHVGLHRQRDRPSRRPRGGRPIARETFHPRHARGQGACGTRSAAVAGTRTTSVRSSKVAPTLRTSAKYSTVSRRPVPTSWSRSWLPAGAADSGLEQIPSERMTRGRVGRASLAS